MTSHDHEIAVAITALRRAGRIGHAAGRMLLESMLSLPEEQLRVDLVLERAAVAQAEINGTLATVRKEIESGFNIGIVPVPMSSLRYPPALRTIADAPLVLYVRGSFDALAQPGVAVVGTRKATAHGLQIASRISEFLARNGWPVVSGLALGIDAAAHEGALLGKSPTVAVLAHGLARASPRANELLAQRILDAGGAWVSEHPPGAPARPENFVLRNRIQVGLSVASVIVEGALHSGSSTQAEFCVRNRRLLFAVLPEQGSRVSTQNELPRMLVKERGATPIESKEDYPKMLDLIERHAPLPPVVLRDG